MENPKTEMVENFISLGMTGKFSPRNEWLYFPDGKVYLRNTKRVIDGALAETVDIATVEAYTLRNGFFRSLLSAVETVARKHSKIVYIENVLYPWLVKLLEEK